MSSRLSAVVSAAGRIGQLKLRGDPEVTVSGITHDSRAVRPGWIFAAMPGALTDGHAYVDQAVRAGAVAVLTERPTGAAVTEVIVDDVRQALGPVSSAVYGHPSRHLRVVAVTGTNGKTTTCHLIAGIFQHLGVPSRALGTLSGVRTTPEAPELQASLAGFVEAGVELVALEASSIGLEQRRLDGTEIAAGVFLNLGVDHLDVHGDMERYFAAKARLFDGSLAPCGVVNADDPYGVRLLANATVPLVPFGRGDVTDVELRARRSRFRWRGAAVEVGLGGSFNVDNAIAAATVAGLLGCAAGDIAAGLGSMSAVPGRFEAVDAGQDFGVVVDYAHTPDGLTAVLAAAREVTGSHRVIVVFGCGGDRDATKRPLMGRAAVDNADAVVITSDNPRGEDPDAIIAAIRSGIPATMVDVVTVEPDRRAAIGIALAMATPGDLVVIAGKGHETTQTVGTTVSQFDDRAVARELLGPVES